MLERAPALAVTQTAVEAPLAWRRWLFAILCVGTIACLMWLMSIVLPPTSITSAIVLILFVIPIPWNVIGFWNSVIGLIIMRRASDPVAAVNPLANTIRGDEPIIANTALLVCIKDEDPQRVVRNLDPMLGELVTQGVGDRFHVYILSDTQDREIAAEEDALFAGYTERWRGKVAMTYRRRPVNAGFKAGNIRDFCERWGGNHDFAITLDADSFMPAYSVLRLVRLMQAHPRLGILQTLIVGLPSISPFARMFQFGMRLGMRSYTLGSAWWQADCGPYWGHNAIIRLKPFIAHCELPKLPQGGPLGDPILSHDQVEAVLMQRAGYEVRVLPEDGTSFEENPPDLVEFIRRDLRWCQGNMQYWWLLGLRNIKPVGRFQLLFAIQMYLGSPVWVVLVALGAAVVFLREGATDAVRSSLGITLFAIIMLMVFAPKIAAIIDVLAHKHMRAHFGGTWRFLTGIVVETIFSMLLSPIIGVAHTIFMTGLLFGRNTGWSRQSRDSVGLAWSVAAARLWPQTILGILVLAVVLWKAPGDLAFAMLATTGLIVSIPFAVLSASPTIGAFLARIRLNQVPEESLPPREILPLHLPAIEVNLPADKRLRV